MSLKTSERTSTAEADCFQEKLHGGVCDDSATHFAAREVFNVLGDSSKTEVVFASTLSEAEEEVGGVVVFHELPASSTMRRRRF